MAMQLKKTFADNGIPFYLDSPTNQQFPILTEQQMVAISDKVAFEQWAPLPDGRFVTRFATSWATPLSHILQLEDIIVHCS